MEKWHAVGRYCHRWWVVAPEGMVRTDELPAPWGLMEPGRFGTLNVRRQAPKLKPEPMPATFVAAFLRATMRTAVPSRD